MSKILFFPLLAKYSQRARPKRNAYFIHKTISVREKIAQIHTNTQRSYCDVMPLLRMVRNCTTVEWYAASQRLSSHRRVHNKLSRCCTIRIVEYESLWDNLGMSDIITNIPCHNLYFAFIFIDTESFVFIIVNEFSLLFDHCGFRYSSNSYGKAKVFEERVKSAHSLKPPKRSCYIEGGKINVVKNRPSFGFLDSARLIWTINVWTG